MKIFLGIYFTFLISNYFSQLKKLDDDILIQTDRPDQTECPFIVPKNHLQIENGFLIENLNSTERTYFFPSTLWKFGINEKVELRLISEITSEQKINETKKGLNPITFGFKLNILNEKGIIPKTSLITHLRSIKIGSRNLNSTYLAPSFRFTMQHQLSKKTTLGYNIGKEWDGETPKPIDIYTLTIGYSFNPKLSGYMEFFGYRQNIKKWNHQMDFGFTYLLKTNFMVDISSGFELLKNTPIYYLSLGCSYRIKFTQSTK
jgi:hypothetical protein